MMTGFFGFPNSAGMMNPFFLGRLCKVSVALLDGMAVRVGTHRAAPLSQDCWSRANAADSKGLNSNKGLSIVTGLGCRGNAFSWSRGEIMWVQLLFCNLDG